MVAQTSAVAWRRRSSGRSAKRGGGAQRDDSSSAVGGTQRLRRIHQHRPQIMCRRTHLRTPRCTNVRVGTSKHTDSYIRTNNRSVKKELQLFAILAAGLWLQGLGNTILVKLKLWELV